MFIKEREPEKARATIYKNRDHLKQFCEWCAEQGIDSVREIDGQHLMEYKFDLRDGKANSTIRNHFSTLRTFFKFCRRIDATREDQHLAEKLSTPDFDKGELARDDMMSFEAVADLFDYLEPFEYATTKHVLFTIFWHNGCRRGALVGLDLEDYEPVEEREHGRYGLLNFHHRPETDTPLKNGKGGERQVIIWPKHGKVIEDYISHKRLDRTDEYGRKPLVTSPVGENGRYRVPSFSSMMYAITRPCKFGQECPHGRDLESCEAMDYDSASRCPSSYSTHPMRRAAITYHLEEQDWTYEGASGRFDVSVKTLKEHYDRSSAEGRRRTRAAQFYNGDHATL